VAAVLPDGPFVVIHPCAGKAYREWPADRFAAVAAGLHEAHGLACVVIGTTGDRATVDALFAALPDAVPRSFVTVKPADLVAVFERAALLLSNESGPTHIAAATDVPIVTIFGPTPEARWRPIRDDGIAVLRGGDCDLACGRRQCVVGNRCLRELSAEVVLENAAALAADRVRISS
ncbi:MAG: glycosyltransferase family 9 protein, partial [Planctomycetota bacterium]